MSDMGLPSLDMGMLEFMEHFNVSEYDPIHPWVITLNSSCLHSVEYNPTTETLGVEFQDGASGAYLLVSYNDFHNLVTNISVGRYFNMYIRNQHTFV